MLTFCFWLSNINFDLYQGNIIESLDKLQQELKFEEAVDQRLASNETAKEVSRSIDRVFVLSSDNFLISVNTIWHGSFYAMGQGKISRGTSCTVNSTGIIHPQQQKNDSSMILILHELKKRENWVRFFEITVLFF